MREKLLTLFLFVCMTMLGTQTVSAQEYVDVADYSENFSTLSSDFDYESWTTTWTYPEGWTVFENGKSNCLSTTSTVRTSGGKSWYGSSSQSIETPFCFVSPAVKGTVSFYVRLYSNYQAPNSSIKLYKMTTDASGNVALGDSIAIKSQWESADASEWTLVTVDLGDEYTKLAFADKYVFMCDFSASYAQMPVKRLLDITAVTRTAPEKSNVYPDSNGDYAFSGTVTVKNVGNVALEAGAENYVVNIIDYSSKKVYATLDVPALAVGKEATLDYSYTINYSDWKDKDLGSRTYWYARFDATTDFGSSSSNYSTKMIGSWLNIYPAIATMTVRDDDGSYDGDVVDFATFVGSKTMSMKLCNDGGADLKISSVDYPEGVSIEELSILPVTIAAGERLPITIKMAAESNKSISGIITFNYEGSTVALDKNDLQSNQIKVQGTVLTPGTYLIDFEDKKVPEGWYVSDADKWTVKTESSYYSGSSYSAPFSDANKYGFNCSSSDGNRTYVITPKLKFEAGESFNYQVAPMSSASEIIVYYSTDRTNWTEAAHYDKEASDGVEVFLSENSSFYDYSVALPEAGEYYFKFEASYLYIDNISGGQLVEVAHDVVAESFAAAGKFEVNTAYTMTAKFQNLKAEAEAAGDYTVKFYVNGEEVGEGDCSADFEGTSSKTFTYSVTPHAAGDYTVKAVFALADGSYTVETEEQTITVAEEKATVEVVVGTKTATTSTYPMKRSYKNSMSEVLYSASLLSEMSANSKILKIAYPYYCTSGDFTQEVTVWLANTDETSISEFTDVSTMTQVYHNAEFKLELGGSSSDMLMLEIPFDEAFEYTGGALKVVFEAKNASSYASATFAAFSLDEDDSDNNVRLNKSSDTYSTYESSSATIPSSWDTAFPVTYFYAEGTPATIVGKVTDWTANGLQGAGLEGATVTFTSGDVVYTATTVEDGTYSVDIIKSDLTYAAKAEKEGYKTVKEKEVDLTSAVNIETRPLSDWPVTITKVPNHDYGYTTLYLNPFVSIKETEIGLYSLVLPDGVEAYVYGVDEGSYTLVPTKIEGIIPAGVAVVLYTADSKYYGDEILLDEAAEEPDEEEIEAWKAKSNLYGCMAKGTTTTPDGETDGYYFYKLQYDYDDDCVGFYWENEYGNSFTSPREKAWLYIQKDVAAKMSNFSIEDGKTATGIATFTTEESNAKGIYTVSGQKMNKASKPGLYIVDGKKVVVK